MGRKLVFRTPPGGCNVSLLVLVKFFLSYLGRLPQLGSDRTHFLSVFIEMLISSLTGRQGEKKKKKLPVLDQPQFQEIICFCF